MGATTKPHFVVCSFLGTEGHQGPLTCVATNQDGSLILTGSVDCQAKLVSATTGKVSVTQSQAAEPLPPMPAPPPPRDSSGPLSSPSSALLSSSASLRGF